MKSGKKTVKNIAKNKNNIDKKEIQNVIESSKEADKALETLESANGFEPIARVSCDAIGSILSLDVYKDRKRKFNHILAGQSTAHILKGEIELRKRDMELLKRVGSVIGLGFNDRGVFTSEVGDKNSKGFFSETFDLLGGVEKSLAKETERLKKVLKFESLFDSLSDSDFRDSDFYEDGVPIVEIVKGTQLSYDEVLEMLNALREAVLSEWDSLDEDFI